jgi:hypothetical protein
MTGGPISRARPTPSSGSVSSDGVRLGFSRRVREYAADLQHFLGEAALR